MIHEMKLQSKPFNQIVQGTKIIESRLFDEKRSKIKIGDIIEFTNTSKMDEKLKVRVIDLLKYKSFQDLMSAFPSEYFGGKTKDELLKQVHSFYPREDEKKYSVIGIRIKKIV